MRKARAQKPGGEEGKGLSRDVLRVARFLTKLEKADYYGKVIVHFAGAPRKVTTNEDILVENLEDPE